MFTGNSQSTSSFYDLMRQMGAAAREMLLEAAAWRLQVPRSHLALRDSVIRVTGIGRSLASGSICP